MQDLGAALPVTSGHVLADFPNHRCLQTILDRERAAFDKQIALKRRQTDDPLERRNKLRVPDGVNVRVGDLNFRRTQKILSHLRLVEVRMIKADRHRTEEPVEVDQLPTVDCVVQVGATTFVGIDYDFETIEQEMLLYCLENVRWRDLLLFFALCGSVSR